MVAGNLDTTNLLLGIMAAVAVFQALCLIVGGILAYRMYTRAMQTIAELEARHVAPLMARVDTLMVKIEPLIARADGVLQTIEKVDDAAGRVKSSVTSRVNTLVGVVNGARNVLGGFFNGRRSSREAPEHAVEAGAGTLR